MNSSEARRVKGRGGGAQRECSESAARSRCPSRAGLALPDSPLSGEGLVFLAWLPGRREGQAGWLGKGQAPCSWAPQVRPRIPVC